MPLQARILIVDDEEAIRVSLAEILEEEGHDVVGAATASQGMELALRGIDVAIVDIKLGSDNGMDLLRKFRSELPTVPVIMISGHGTVALTAEAFRLGARDFLEKPLRLIQVRTSVRNALEAIHLKRRVTEQEKKSVPRPVYASAVMRQLYSQVKRLAAISEPVVVMGPSGAGKELVVRALHFEGPRSGGPFVATNAASLPLTLAEDELFGHEKGAFTGAIARRIGCLEQADTGTLFLDEIGDMDPAVQAKILRVLETGEFTRLGGARPVLVNVRIVAATHKDLPRLVAQESFRHDLWYRLSAFVLEVPPLSKRKEDIPLLAKALLDTVCAEMGVTRNFSNAALERLAQSDFPGNIRELKHVVTRAAVFVDSETIGEEILRSLISGSRAEAAASTAADYTAFDFRTARERFEKDYLSGMLQRCGNNVTATAATIGMAQSNLSRKLKELGIR